MSDDTTTAPPVDDWPGWTGLRVGPNHLAHHGHPDRERDDS